MNITDDGAAGRLQFHPAAGIFELLDQDGAEFKELVTSIKERGLRVPVVLHPDGSILDGRNRYLACLAAAIEPRSILGMVSV